MGALGVISPGQPRIAFENADESGPVNDALMSMWYLNSTLGQVASLLDKFRLRVLVYDGVFDGSDTNFLSTEGAIDLMAREFEWKGGELWLDPKRNSKPWGVAC